MGFLFILIGGYLMGVGLVMEGSDLKSKLLVQYPILWIGVFLTCFGWTL